MSSVICGELQEKATPSAPGTPPSLCSSMSPDSLAGQEPCDGQRGATAGALCRLLLTGEGFFGELARVRSMLRHADVEKIEAARSLLQQLIWVDALPVPHAGASPQAEAIAELCRHGQAVLLEDPARWGVP